MLTLDSLVVDIFFTQCVCACVCARVCVCLVVTDHIHVVPARLLRGGSPAVHVLVALPLLLRLGRLLLQLLTLVLRSAVLKPHLHLRTHRHTQLS